MSPEYRTSSHAIFDIKYHLCWCTKYRYKVLEGEIALRCREWLRQIAMSREVTIIRGALSLDHVHMLVSAPSGIAVSKLVQYLKGRSSRKLQVECAELKRRYWGQHFGARGYFCATVGAVTEETIKQYVEKQKWDDDGGEGFKIVQK